MKTTIDKILRMSGVKKDGDIGLGDTVANITEAVGFAALVAKMKKDGSCGGCQRRREMLNKKFPFGIKGPKNESE